MLPETKYAVSVKAVLRTEKGFVLLWNERNEWELPGGRLEPGESPQEAVQREIEEELNLRVAVGGILNSWIYVVNGSPVFIVTYAIPEHVFSADCRISHEHKKIGFFQRQEVAALPLPQGYKASIELFSAHQVGREIVD